MFDTYISIETPGGGFDERHELYPLLPEGTVFRTGGHFYVVTSSFIDLDEQPDTDAVAVQYISAFPRS
jgi:hypothetical protein